MDKKVPELRFAGFTDDWKQRKLGEISERVTRKNTDLSTILPLTISAQYGLVAQTDFFDKQVAGKNLANYYVIQNGEFAYNKSYSSGFPFGTIKRLDFYKKGLLSILYILFKVTKVNSQFLVAYFDSNHWHNSVSNIAVEGARNHGLLNIPTNDFFQIPILIPSSEIEQEKIGNFFRQLDDTIAFHQRTQNKYKMLKNCYLEKIFSSPNYAWKQRKLSELIDSVQGNDGRKNLPILTISASRGWLEQQERFSHIIAGTELQNYTLLKKGNLSYNRGNSKIAKYGTVFELTSFDEALVPKIYHSFSVKIMQTQHSLNTYLHQKRLITSFQRLLAQVQEWMVY